MSFDRYRPHEVELGPWPPGPGGADHAREAGLVIEDSALSGAVLYRSPDGKRAVGILKVTPGRVKGRYGTDDVSVLLEGRLTVVEEDREPQECRPGDLLITHAGAEMEWIVHETAVRLWDAYHDQGVPF